MASEVDLQALEVRGSRKRSAHGDDALLYTTNMLLVSDVYDGAL